MFVDPKQLRTDVFLQLMRMERDTSTSQSVTEVYPPHAAEDLSHLPWSRPLAPELGEEYAAFESLTKGVIYTAICLLTFIQKGAFHWTWSQSYS